MNAIRTFWTKNAKRAAGPRNSPFNVPPVVCADGFEMSVQASEVHYCSPRELLPFGDYVSWEVGFPSALEPDLMPYCEDPEHPLDTVYGYVPTATVNAVIAKHGGLACKKAA